MQLIEKKWCYLKKKYSNNINSYSDFKTSYFDNITYNFGMNYKGSCVYVAIGMLLSYYDSYISDNIIPEQYDINSYGSDSNMIARRNSPGIMRDIISSPYDDTDAGYGFDMDAQSYYSSISSLSSVSLHAKLINIAANKGYYDFSDNENPCGSTYKSRYDVLNDYLQNVVGYKLNYDYSINEYNGYSSESVKEFTINQIKIGRPVLLSVSNGKSGHVVIAYDYDVNTDAIYCHMGWSAAYTRCTVEDIGFTRYTSALTLNFTALHSHSNNYAVTSINNNIPSVNYYCYDDTKINVFKHKHEYNFTYVPYSNNKHKACCVCGEYVLKLHCVDLDQTWMSGGQKYGNCIECAALINLNNTHVIIYYPNSKYMLNNNNLASYKGAVYE